LSAQYTFVQGGGPIDVPRSWIQVVSPNVKTFKVIIISRASIRASEETLANSETCSRMCWETNCRARSVLMLVYIDTASAMNKRAPGGTSMVTSSVLRSKLLLKYAFFLVAYFWSLSLAQRPMPWSRLPLRERMGRVFIGDLCIFMRRYKHQNGSVFSRRWQRKNVASFLVSTRLYFSIHALNVVRMYLE
jgi:hypothetical protein